MDAKRLEKCQRRLYRRTPFIGQWLRRKAAKMLVEDGSHRAVRTLAEAVAGNDDPRVRHLALEAIRHVTEQNCIDAVCGVWASTRHAGLSQVLVERSWAASSPVQVWVLSALHVGQWEMLAEGGEDVAEPLLHACKDSDANIAEQALLTLRQLRNPDAREAVCRALLYEDHPTAREAVVTARFAPRDPQQRALFYFLTEQWDQYESLDFDHSLLRTAYATADEWLRARVAEKARQAGRVEWVQVVSGGRQGRRLGEMTDGEWESVLAVLTGGKRWEELWQLLTRAQ